MSAAKPNSKDATASYLVKPDRERKIVEGWNLGYSLERLANDQWLHWTTVEFILNRHGYYPEPWPAAKKTD